ncbi:hypothetical protein GCM10010885_20190 [Alicyclobacillus cellulosilyticus]|uniref:Uncharacterized protein n=1 Tax=Alicyclobacillus cellulosilyticus TaxID=1003997 RepID=A0A917NNG6_9BACL|nr:hypothetical protein GCM10010885_20190 [Alicyclobacillus cellulosilyticus]
MDKFAQHERDRQSKPLQKLSPWKTFAVFSGATLQLGACTVVFGYLGHLLALRWHAVWLTAAGTLAGVVVGASGLAFLVKQWLGDKP